jgi:hypothetical protein
MSATSSQYRNPAQTPPHYHDYPPAAHDALTGLATWQHDAVAAAAAATAVTHDSYAIGPSTAAFLHYPQPGVDSASLHAPSTWPAGYVRHQGPHEWQQQHQQQHQQQPDETYAERTSVSYCKDEGTAPVPHHQLPAISRHYQHQHHHHQPVLNTEPALSLTAHGHFRPLRISAVSARYAYCAGSTLSVPRRPPPPRLTHRTRAMPRNYPQSHHHHIRRIPRLSCCTQAMNPSSHCTMLQLGQTMPPIQTTPATPLHLPCQ